MSTEAKKTTYIVSCSGGKDSIATWLYLERELGLDVECVFAETGHEARDTYQYLDYLRGEGCPLTVVQGNMQQLRKNLSADDPLTMLSLAKHKTRFPSKMARFCTTELKLVPLKAHLDKRRLEEPETTFVMCCGVRREESASRAAITQDRGMDDFMGVERWLPILDWKVEEVFAIHRRHRIAPNPLYSEGMSRVGCFPCIFAKKSELASIARRRPEAFDRLYDMEREVGGTFFSPSKVPMRFRSFVKPPTTTRCPTANDVRAWALSEPPPTSRSA